MVVARVAVTRVAVMVVTRVDSDESGDGGDDGSDNSGEGGDDDEIRTRDMKQRASS